MKDKAINANLLVPCNTNLVDETLLVSKCTKSGHEPAVPVTTLAYITSCGTVDVKLGVFEDILTIEIY